MPVQNASEVVEFDADAAFEAVKATVSGTLRSFVEFDGDQFNPLYVDDSTLAFYEDEDHMLEHFAQLHSYVYLDLAEMDLFTTELFPVADRVEYITTTLDFFKLVRVYYGDEGVFIALDHDEPVEPIVQAIGQALGNGRYPEGAEA